MLPPKKTTAKKPNPAKKYKKTSSEVDWDKVRAFNDNTAVQLAKVFDPTGISSYPDVYYAAKDLAEGKGSWEDLGINVLGALPMVGKSKVLFKLNKASNATKAVKNTKKVLKTVEKVAEKANKIVTAPINKLKPLATSTKVVPRVIGKGAQKTEAVAKTLGKPLSPKNQTSSTKQITKTDIKNVAVDLLDIGNVAADVKSVAKATQSQVIEPIVQKQKDKEYQPIPKKVIYYNTDPERGPVEKPGTESNTSYTPITNSAQLKKWKEQQLAYGTNSQGIMKRKMNPNKKYANGTNANGMDPNHYIISPAEAMNDYNIMLAKAESEALSNPWLPITAMAGGLMQQGIGMAGSFTGGGKATPNPSGVKGVMAGATAANGMNSVEGDVEVEGGEMFETPQGEVGEFEGPSHEEGGIPLEVGQDVEQGTKVYSDRLKVGDKTLAERKEARERRTANLEKAAAQPLIDVATKNALKRKMEAIQKEEMADLQFQDQVNNIQAMADTMVKAFGTGAEGIQKMVNGGIVGETEYDEFGNPIVKPAVGPVIDLKSMGVSPGVSDLGTPKPTKFKLTGNPLTDFASNPREYMKTIISPDTYFKDTNNVKTFQDWMDTNNPNWLSTGKSLDKGTGYGNYGPNTQKAAENNFEAFKTSLLPAETPAPAPTDYGAGDFLATFNTGDTPDANASTTVAKTGETAKTEAEGKEPSKFMKALGENTPAIGDIAKLMGDYLGMTAGIKTAAEQRSTDVTHRNTFANAGKESQKLLDNAKQGIETSKAQAIVKATDVGRGGKRGGRNSARGVNQMRAMDWLYDTALQQQIAEISANAAQQISGIDVQKSGVAMNADQLRGKGEYDAAMANEAAKDAYYTALGKGRNQFAEGLMQSGKDLNAMKQNKILEKLLTQDGEYAGMTAKGEFYGKPAKKKETKTEDEYEIELDAQGNKFITIQGKKVLIKK